MALVRYEPWDFVSQLQNDINEAFRHWGGSETSSVTAPAVDVEEYENRFQLFVDLPGMRANQVEITLEGGVLTLSGERPEQKRKEQVVHRRRERGQGRFYRRFILPETVDADGVKATERNGVLEITIPKRASAQPRRIKVAA